MKPNKQQGRFVEIRIIDQYNSHEVLFKGKALMTKPDDVNFLFRNAMQRGLTFMEEDEATMNRRFLFGQSGK